jgi:hypothetical protein
VDTDSEDEDEDEEEEEHIHAKGLRVDEGESKSKVGSHSAPPSKARVPDIQVDVEITGTGAARLTECITKGQKLLTSVDSSLADTLTSISELRGNSSKSISDINEFFDTQQRALEKRRQALIEQAVHIHKTKASALSESLINLQSAHSSLTSTLSIAADTSGPGDAESVTDRLEKVLKEVAKVSIELLLHVDPQSISDLFNLFIYLFLVYLWIHRSDWTRRLRVPFSSCRLETLRQFRRWDDWWIHGWTSRKNGIDFFVYFSSIFVFILSPFVLIVRFVHFFLFFLFFLFFSNFLKCRFTEP